MTDAEKLDAILAKVTRIEERMDSTESMVAKVVEEVKPTIDELMNSSLFKMLGMKKK
jgi:hypothetical protein